MIQWLKKLWFRYFVEGTVGYELGMLHRHYDAEVDALRDLANYSPTLRVSQVGACIYRSNGARYAAVWGGGVSSMYNFCRQKELLFPKK